MSTGRPSPAQAPSGSPRVLITGYGGFAGGHLADELAAETDWQVIGTVFADPTLPAGAVHRPDPAVQTIAVDLRDPGATHDLFAQVAPAIVFHLAGQAFVPAAWADPWSTFETNVRMQINVLEAAAKQAAAGTPVRVVAVTSMEVYGAVPPDALPVAEDCPLAPINPYATSKAAQDLVAGQYARSHGLDVVRVRPFNHIGPRQDERFVVPAFARQVAEIEAGLRPPELHVGAIDAERDFTDVRDIARGYRLAAQRAQAGAVYNLGSGRPHRIRDIVTLLLDRASVPIAVVTDPARLRPVDIPRTQCDPGKAARELGWVPRVPLEQTVAEVLDEWRARIGAAGPSAAALTTQA